MAEVCLVNIYCQLTEFSKTAKQSFNYTIHIHGGIGIFHRKKCKLAEGVDSHI